jgi:hypothetical protein
LAAQVVLPDPISDFEGWIREAMNPPVIDFEYLPSVDLSGEPRSDYEIMQLDMFTILLTVCTNSLKDGSTMTISNRVWTYHQWFETNSVSIEWSYDISTNDTQRIYVEVAR